MSLTNMLGQQLLSRDVDQDLHMDIDTDMLPKGIYFLRLTTDSGGLVVKKVTKK